MNASAEPRARNTIVTNLIAYPCLINMNASAERGMRKLRGSALKGKKVRVRSGKIMHAPVQPWRMCVWTRELRVEFSPPLPIPLSLFASHSPEPRVI